MSDDYEDNEDFNIEDVLHAAIEELLNIASGVAELQVDDASAEEIYTICDVVAEYYGIKRAVAVTTENDDGSFTTRFEEPDLEQTPTAPRTTSIPGSIRTSGKPKLRVIDKDTPLDIDDEDDDD